MATLGNLPFKNKRNKTASYTKNDRKDRTSKSLSASQSATINDENATSTGDKNATTAGKVDTSRENAECRA